MALAMELNKQKNKFVTKMKCMSRIDMIQKNAADRNIHTDTCTMQYIDTKLIQPMEIAKVLYIQSN